MTSPLCFKVRLLLLSAALFGTIFGTKYYLELQERTGEAKIADFPLDFQGWKGNDKGLPSPVLMTLGVDDFIMREYNNGNSRFWLYVGYYRNQRKAKTIHSPKHCYPAAGWEKIQSSVIPIRVKGGDGHWISIPVNRYLLGKAGELELVYYWYQMQNTAIASEYEVILTRFLNSISKNRTDGALVRVSVRIGKGDIAEAEKVAAMIPHIYNSLIALVPI
jgi:EpsI family protein